MILKVSSVWHCPTFRGNLANSATFKEILLDSAPNERFSWARKWRCLVCLVLCASQAGQRVQEALDSFEALSDECPWYEALSISHQEELRPPQKTIPSRKIIRERALVLNNYFILISTFPWYFFLIWVKQTQFIKTCVLDIQNVQSSY